MGTRGPGLGLLLLLASCRPCRLDEDETRWTDEFPASLADVGPGSARPDVREGRLMIDLGEGELRTEFLVDTGYPRNLLSSCAPIAKAVQLVREPTRREKSHGQPARLGLMYLGSMRVRGVGFTLIEQVHTRALPVNVIGAPLLFPLLIGREEEGWWIADRTHRAVPEHWDGVKVVMVSWFVPCVRLVRDDGRETFGVIDTGAPVAYATKGWVGRDYRVRGAEWLTFRPQKTLHNNPFDGQGELGALLSGGVSDPNEQFPLVEVLIGLEVLARHRWVLDMEKRRWWVAKPRR